MSENLSLAGIIRTSKYFGHVALPCWVRQTSINTWMVEEQLAAGPPPEKSDANNLVSKLYQLAKKLDVNEIARRHSRGQKAAAEFFAGVNTDDLNHIVLPNFWKDTSKLIHELAENRLPLYFADDKGKFNSSDQIILSEVNATLKLIFDRHAAGITYKLEVWQHDRKIRLQGQDFIMLCVSPCIFVAGKQLHRLDHVFSGKLLKPFIKKPAVEIPERVTTEYFKKFIQVIAAHAEIEAKGFILNDLDIQPQALLTLEKNWQGKAGLTLNFNYNGRKILANNARKSFISLLADSEQVVFNRLKRDTEWEQEKISILKKTGLVDHGAFFCFNDDDVRAEYLNFVSFLSHHKKELLEAGFVIEQEGNMSFTLEKPDITFRETFQRDWFDLFIQVKIASYVIPFMRFKQHLLNNIRVYELPSGEYFLLPEEWFERYRWMILHGKETGENTRFSNHYRTLAAAVIHHTKPEEPESLPSLDADPAISNVSLRNYQYYGFLWLRRHVQQGSGAILADDMGLGKTLQTIALISTFFKEQATTENPVKENNPSPGCLEGAQLDLFDSSPATKTVLPQQNRPTSAPALIVVPVSIVHNWVAEIRKFAPHLKVYCYVGADRSLQTVLHHRAHVVITTYGLLRNDIELLKNIEFSFVILDESQQIKNPASKTSQAAFELSAKHRFTLTGTPIENRLSDLWSQLHFVNPGMTGTLADFMQYYAAPIAQSPGGRESKELLRMIRPFILRRTKAQVEPELPAFSENVILCEMTSGQSKLYEIEKSRQRNFILQNFSRKGIEKSLFIMLQALMKLRQLGNHPRLLFGESPEGSGKFDAVIEILETLLEENHKVLVFSSFTGHLALFEDHLNERAIRFAKLTGETRRREEVINQWKSSPEVNVFLISLKAGGVGLNLTEAAYVLILDPWWNPAAEMQAISRAHRIGQDKKVMVYRFISRNTVEEKIIKMQESKQMLADSFIKEEQAIAGMSREEMLDLFE
jgi:SNF2 family DNA or RNA helicase